MKRSWDGEKPRPKALFEHKGLVYRPEVHEDLKKDTYRVDHWVEDLHMDGRMFCAEYTPHHSMSKGDFKMYVDLGCPRQVMDRPWSHHSLREAYKKKPETLDDKINKAFKRIVEKTKSAVRKTRNT